MHEARLVLVVFLWSLGAGGTLGGKEGVDEGSAGQTVGVVEANDVVLVVPVLVIVVEVLVALRRQVLPKNGLAGSRLGDGTGVGAFGGVVHRGADVDLLGRHAREVGQVGALERLHLLSLASILVVVAHEVQAAVRQQETHLVGRIVAKLRSLLGHNRGADDEVAHHEGLAVLHVVGVVDVERQHVGGLVDAAVLQVQAVNLVGVDETDRDLARLGATLPLKHARHQALDFLSAQDILSYLVVYLNAHVHAVAAFLVIRQLGCDTGPPRRSRQGRGA